MANRVYFRSRDPRGQVTDFIPFQEDFLRESPEVFNNERDGGSVNSLNAVFLMFFDEEQPYFYYRHSDPDKTRFVGICKLGDSPLDYQKGGVTFQLACPHKNDAFVAYHKISDDPCTYGFYSEDHAMEIQYSLDSGSVHEKNIFNCKGVYLPLTTIDHFNVWPNGANIYQGAEITGIFNGKPIKGMGRFSRSFTRKSCVNQSFNFDFHGLNTNNELIGIRPDGRREECVIDIMSEGNVWAYYWLEGEPPVTADEVEVEADWYRLPYLDDGICIYKEITFRFAGKEIHVTGKWGHKGFTGYPRMDKKGQAEVCGPWYEGSVPYEHRNYMSFNEVQEAYADTIKKLGFSVIE